MRLPRASALQRKLAAGLVRRAALTDASLLAGPLRIYAEAEGLGWEDLALRVGTTEDGLNRVAMCRPPRPDHFLEDTEEIARGAADPQRLLDLLRQLQVLGAFVGIPKLPAHSAAPGFQDVEGRFGGTLAAARDFRVGEEVIDCPTAPDEHSEAPEQSDQPDEPEKESE